MKSLKSFIGSKNRKESNCKGKGGGESFSTYILFAVKLLLKNILRIAEPLTLYGTNLVFREQKIFSLQNLTNDGPNKQRINI